MKKIITNYGGALFFYFILFIGVVALNTTMINNSFQKSSETNFIALND